MAIVDSVLPVFLVVGTGYLLRVTGFLREPTTGGLSRLVFYVAAPVLLFRSALRTHPGESLDLGALGVAAAVSVIVALVVYLAAARTAPSRRGVLAQGAHRSNMVFMGLPIAVGAYGEAALDASAVLIGFMILGYNLLAVLVLTLPHADLRAADPAMWRRTVREIFLNPLIVGCGLGILGAVAGLRLPVFLDRAVDLVGRTALPVALIVVGAGLDLGRLRHDLGSTAVVSLIKLIVYPALVLLALRWLGYTGLRLEVPVLVLASPTAVVSVIMAREMRGDEPLAGAIVIGSTLLSLVTITGWLVLFRLL